MSDKLVLTKSDLQRRADRVREVNARTDTRGMTRPARPSLKRESLDGRGGLGPFVEGTSPRPTEIPAKARSRPK